MLYLYARITNWLRREEGQDLIEYVLLVALIALAVVAVFPAVATAIVDIFCDVIDELTGI